MLRLIPLFSFLLSMSLVNSNPACQIDTIQACMMPALLKYSFSPEAQQLSALKMAGPDWEYNITASQLTTGCLMMKAMVDCGADYVVRCVGKDVADAHDFARGTQTLMGTCDKPDLFAKMSVLMTCGKALKANRALMTCSDNVTNRFDYFKSVRDINGALDVLRTGRVMKDFCCGLREAKGCSDPHMSTCSAEAISLNEQVYDAVVAAYGCAERTATGCEMPVQML